MLTTKGLCSNVDMFFNIYIFTFISTQKKHNLNNSLHKYIILYKNKPLRF